MSTGSGNKYPVFTLGTFITKGYGPKSAVDLDMCSNSKLNCL